MLTRRALNEIANSFKCSDYKFIHDAEGVYDSEEPGCSYLCWTVQAGSYIGQTHILRFKWVYGSNEKKFYPANAPNVVFLTPMWHTNVSPSSGGGGSICVDILREDSTNPSSWSPMYSLTSIFTSIILLLEEHNGASAYNGRASSDFKEAKEANRMDVFIDRANKYYSSMLEKTPDDHSVKKLLKAFNSQINNQKDEKS